MKVYAVRHGQTVGNVRNNSSGWSSTSLTELGHQQAKAANALLKDIPFDRIYCSDLYRTQQTAQDALPGCHPVLSDKLREISVGDLADTPVEESRQKYGEILVNSVRFEDYSAFGGESQAEMRQRVSSFMKELEQLKGTEYVAVICHEGTIHQMLNYVLKADLLLENIHIENASVTVFSYESGTWKLEKFSHTGVL